jgi:hypothetical protein
MDIIMILLFIILVLILSFIVFQFNKFTKFIEGGKSKSRLKTAVVPKKHSSDVSFKLDSSLKTAVMDKKHSSGPYAVRYTISGEDNGLDYSQLRLLLTEANILGFHFVERPITEMVHVSFGTFKDDAVVRGEVRRWNYDPLFFKQKAAIKNTLGNHAKIINKSELYNTIKQLIPNSIKYLPKSYTIVEFEELLKKNNQIKFPVIIKKDRVTQQKAIKILLSKDEYFVTKKQFNIKNDAVVSEYIANPLLLDGKKMHLRVYYLLSVISGIIRCTVHDEYRIYLAEEKYKKDDWLNPNTHISGVSGKTKNKRYHWPDDISDNILINEKMNKFNKVICTAFTIAGIKNYPESYTGYHLYGADVMITDDFHVYLLEVNHAPGFRFAENEEGWQECNKVFSKRLFSFILDNTIFPFFGIKRPPTYTAEFISTGQLAPFANHLIGPNKCFLIPYLDSLNAEIKKVKNIKLFSDELLFENIIKNCDKQNIYLISYLTNLSSIIIGYIVLNTKNHLCMAITKEYQNIGIASAIMAQFIEIYMVRYFTQNSFVIYIYTDNPFIQSTARRLSFTFNKTDHFFEKDCKKHNYLTL